MLLTLDIFILLLLFLAIWQDHKYRAIPWLVFPLLAILLCCRSLVERTFGQLMEQSLPIIIFIALQLVLLSVWFSLRQKRFVVITNSYLGWGDVLFLFCSALVFSPVNFILFYVGGLALALLVILLRKLLSMKQWATVPLAGIQASLLAIVIILDHFLPTAGILSGNYLSGLAL